MSISSYTSIQHTRVLMGNVRIKPISLHSEWEGSNICRQIGIKHCWEMGLSKIQEKLPTSFITCPHLDVKCKIHKKKLGKDNFLCCYGRFKKFQKVFLKALGCHDWTNKSGSSKGHFKDTIFWKKNPLRLMQIFTTVLEIWKTMTKISSVSMLDFTLDFISKHTMRKYSRPKLYQWCIACLILAVLWVFLVF